MYSSIHITMNPLSNEERGKLFKEAVSESDSYFRIKDYEKAFQALSKANLYLPAFTDHHDYLSALIIIKDKSSWICEKDKNPDHEADIIFSLESFALGIARDLVSFPFLSPFYYRKKNKYSFDPENLGDFMELSLKELNIYNRRKEFFDEYTKFLYDELPIIYGIPPKYNEETIKSVNDNRSRNWKEWDELFIRFPEELHQRNITIVTYKIYDFISKLILKYHNIGKSL